MKQTPKLIGAVWGKARAECNGDYSDERLKKAFAHVLRSAELTEIAIRLRGAGALDRDTAPEEVV